CGFPYAVRLAEDRGATRILIQPRIKDQSAGEVRPDVFAEMPSGLPLIIEIEIPLARSSSEEVQGTRSRNFWVRPRLLLSLVQKAGDVGKNSENTSENPLN